MKPQTFEDYIKDVHAEQYHGFDDDMCDDYNQFEMEMDTSEMMQHAQKWGNKMSAFTQDEINKIETLIGYVRAAGEGKYPFGSRDILCPLADEADEWINEIKS